MTDGWLQFETEPSIVHDCIFTLVSKSRMGKSPNPKCQTPNLRFCTMVSLKHFSQVKFQFGLPSKRACQTLGPRELPGILEPKIGHFSDTACGSIDMV